MCNVMTIINNFTLSNKVNFKCPQLLPSAAFSLAMSRMLAMNKLAPLQITLLCMCESGYKTVCLKFIFLSDNHTMVKLEDVGENKEKILKFIPRVGISLEAYGLKIFELTVT